MKKNGALKKSMAFCIMAAGTFFLFSYYARQTSYAYVEALTRPVRSEFFQYETGRWVTKRVDKTGLAVNSRARFHVPENGYLRFSLLDSGLLIALPGAVVEIDPDVLEGYFFERGRGYFIPQEYAARYRDGLIDDIVFSISVAVSGDTVKQGRMFTVAVEADAALDALEGVFGRGKMRFYPRRLISDADEGHGYVSLYAVDVAHPPGEVPMEIRAAAASGVTVFTTLPVEVESETYAFQRQWWHSVFSRSYKDRTPYSAGGEDTESWDDKRERILGSPKLSAENRQVFEIYKTFTPVAHWRNQQFVIPVAYFQRISSIFGKIRYLLHDSGSYHRGIDFASHTGTPVLAACPGVVLFADETLVRGNLVILDHGLGIISSYYHLDTITVQSNDFVEAGQKIATVGNTGLSTGPHLHFEILANGIHFDPNQLFFRTINIDLPASP